MGVKPCFPFFPMTMEKNIPGIKFSSLLNKFNLVDKVFLLNKTALITMLKANDSPVETNQNVEVTHLSLLDESLEKMYYIIIFNHYWKS